MKKTLPPEVESARVGGPANSGPLGAFKLLCPHLGRTLLVVASDGRDWFTPQPCPTANDLARLPPRVREIAIRKFGDRKEVIFPAPAWEHVSVSASTTPTWTEMCWVKDIFWDEEEAVIQFHPPKSLYINDHDRCLHLWRVIDQSFPLPPQDAV